MGHTLTIESTTYGIGGGERLIFMGKGMSALHSTTILKQF